MYHLSIKFTSILLIALLANVAYPSRTYASDKQDKEVRFAKKIKGEIEKLGTGPDARIEVKLRDKTRVKGYVSEVRFESFTIVDDKVGSSTTLTYPQVKQVKGNNLSTGAKIAIGVGITVGVLVILALLAPHIAQ